MWDEGVNIYNYKNNLDLAQYCDWVLFQNSFKFNSSLSLMVDFSSQKILISTITESIMQMSQLIGVGG